MKGSRPPNPVHPMGTPPGLSTNTGPLAAASWLVARELQPREPKWFVKVVLAHEHSLFRLEIFSEEWGFFFEHGGRTSWIRVTDIAFAHGRDEHDLLPTTPKLRDIGRWIETVERTHGFRFDRKRAIVQTNIDGAEQAIREWATTL